MVVVREFPDSAGQYNQDILYLAIRQLVVILADCDDGI